MNSTEGVNNSPLIDVIDSSFNEQDFVTAVYLERGGMLNAEVRKVVGGLETSAELLNRIGVMISKANIAQNGSPDYTQTTWVNIDNSIVLDNGYSLSIEASQADKRFVLRDVEDNQLIFQDRALIPVPKGESADAMKSAIPVDQDLTLVLDDGTNITLKAVTPEAPVGMPGFSEELADIAAVYITRGNQGIAVTGLDGENSPNISSPNIEGGSSRHSFNGKNINGYVLLEEGGVHQWSYDGRSANSFKNTPEEGTYFSRQPAVQKTHIAESDGIPALTPSEVDVLKNTLKIHYADASNTGHLTPAEWGELASELQGARDNMTGSHQLQAAELKRVLSVLNDNFDVMSNAKKRVDGLIKNINGITR